MGKKSRPLVLLRLSSIGDILISSELLSYVSNSKYLPIFFVSIEYLEILRSLKGLRYAITITSKEQKLNFYLRQNESENFEEIAFSKFLASLEEDCEDSKSLLLDLQNTQKSRRASELLRRVLFFKGMASVSKRVFFRFYIIIKAYFLSFFQQKKRPRKLSLRGIITVHDLQLRALGSLLIKSKEENVNAKNAQSPLRVVFPNLSKNYGEYIIFFPSSSYFNKSWPKEKFKRLKEHVLKSTSFNVLICGAQKDVYLGEYIGYPENNRVINLVNKLTISETLSLIYGAKYIISGDSFAGHAANLYKVPGSVIFGPTSPKFGFVPKYKNINIEYAALNCSPCSRHGQGECRFMNLRCQEEIKVKKIFENILSHTI